MMIESLQNEKIKNLVRLNTDNRFRKKSGFFVVEGKQENERALEFNYTPKEFYICETIFKGEKPNGTVYTVSEKVYEKIAYRGTSEGIIGIFETKEHTITTYTPEENSTVIIVEGLEKPGNLGAILRSCEAFGIDALVVTNAKADFYNPNVIRSSVGCFFGMNIFETDNEELYSFLQQHNFNICTTFMDDNAQELSKQNFNSKSAVLFGTEHSGLSSFWKEKGKNFLIPMSGTIDSLNLSNAVAICCYESLRQKK